MKLGVFVALCGNKHSTMRLHPNSYEDIFDALGGTLLSRGLHTNVPRELRQCGSLLDKYANWLLLLRRTKRHCNVSTT